MAGNTGSAKMELADLRQTGARGLERLFAEEQQNWLRELSWDYGSALQLIRRFIEAHSLAGYVAMAEAEAAGYGYYVVEERKGLVGGLFVSERYSRPEVSRVLLEELVTTLRGTPGVERVEAQLMPFGCSFEEVLTRMGFRLFTRQFMMLPLEQAEMNGARFGEGLKMEKWQERHFEACAKLIRESYRTHVDGEINDQYRSEAGALRFLKSIISLPGCGQFVGDASFVLRGVASEKLVGVVLTSEVSDGVAHTTQICVAPEEQGKGLGRKLMEVSIRALAEKRFKALSLTVTKENAGAVGLYERLGFRTIKSFAAGVWEVQLTSI